MSPTLRMLRGLSLLALLALPLDLVHAAQTPAAKAPAKQAPKPPPMVDLDLEQEIDPTIAFLRGSQDLKSGSYAGGVEGTAWVLTALADSPRHYRRVDGPFVAKALDYLIAHQAADGSIHDEKATGAAIQEQTALGLMALNRHADEVTKPAIAKALAFVGASSATPPATGVVIPADKDAAMRLAIELVARRGPDHAWDGPKGKVIESSRVVVALSEVYARTQSATGSAAPASIKKLPAITEVDKAKTAASILRGAQFLVSKMKDGKCESRPGEPNAGITGMAVGALQSVAEPRPPEIQKAIDQALAWLVSLQKKDGAIHDGELANYTTSAAVMALARANKPEYKPIVTKARDWLIALQDDEAEGYSPDHPFYGGNSYGDEQRPDLSNVQFALEALAASGLEKGNEAYKRALVFLQRCQNRSESNDIKLTDVDGKTIVSGNDGGGNYGPGTSKAGFVELADGKKIARSYGSMSYALLKGYILCGLPKEDPRMKACWDWLRKNYTLDVNPGFEASSDPAAPYQGLFYYLHTMAKTLALYGEETVVDASGKANPWRAQLCGRVIAMQNKQDGSWTNENASRWWEGNPVIATTWAVLSLDSAMPK